MNSSNMVDFAQQLQLPPPPPPPPPMHKSPNRQKKTPFQDNVESIDMDLSDDESLLVEENNGNMFSNSRMEQHLLPPPPIPPHLCDMSVEDIDELENGSMRPHNMGQMPPMIAMGDPMNWNEEWEFNGMPPPQEMHRFPPPGGHAPHNKRPYDAPFRGGFRGRGNSDHGDFRGRARGRGFRGMRGMNNWVPNRGFSRGNRGFRGQFRGGF